MKTTLHLRFAAATLLIGGCAAQNDQHAAEQARLSQIDSRIGALEGALASSQQQLQALGQNQTQSTLTLENQLSGISDELADLPSILSGLCQAPAPVAVPECEATSVQRVVVNSDKMLVGELEEVWVDPPGASLIARVDSGATSSSLNADNITTFERDGEDWARFDVTINKEPVQIERPILRYVRVIQQADPGGSRRPVVQMHVRLGDVQDTFDFTLADRSHLDNEMILGRNFLTDVALVDVSRQFIQPRSEP